MVTDTFAPRFDVFLSYSHRDNEWVRKDLVPKLEASKVRVLVDYRDFEAGAPTVEEIQRAIEQSRKTLVVLTDDYLQSDWTNFERYLVQTEDPGNARRRLIPLRRGNCQLPVSIRYLTYVDFGNPEYLETEWQKLLRALGSASTQTPMPAAAPSGAVSAAEVQATTGSARQGLDALLEIVRDASAQADVTTFKAVFGESSKQIEVLAFYKDLHDLLHTLQFKCYNYLTALLRNLEKSQDDASVWDNCVDYENTVQDLVGTLTRMAAQEELSQRTGPLVKRLTGELTALFVAVRNCDAAHLKKALVPLRRLLATEPTLMNARLTEAARALPLRKLADVLARLYNKFDHANVNHETLARFKNGVDALAELSKTVTLLIDDHDRWQRIDDELRRVEATLALDLSELSISWPELNELTAAQCQRSTDEWALRLTEASEKLDQAVAANDLNRSRQYFSQYRSRVGNTFYKVDLDLKKLCDQLRRIGEPLAALAEIL